MLRQITTLVLACVLWAPRLAYGDGKGAGGDVCAARPDLCDDGPAMPMAKKKKRATTSTKDELQRAIGDVEQHGLASPRPAAARAPVRRDQGQTRAHCRMPNSAFGLEQADWPLCNSHTPIATATKPADKAPPAVPARAPASVPAMRLPAVNAPSLSFEEYMAQNASHPALDGKIKDHQQAFADTAKPAVISFPGDPATPAAPAAGAAPGAAPGAAAPAIDPNALPGGLTPSAAAAAAAYLNANPAAAAAIAPGAAGAPPPSGPVR